MADKYVKLEHVQELLKLIYKRDGYYDWSSDYEKYDKKVKNTTAWLERNAKEIDQQEAIMGKKEFRLLVSRVNGSKIEFYYDTKVELTVAEMMIAKGLDGFAGATAQQWIDANHVRYCGESKYMHIIL